MEFFFLYENRMKFRGKMIDTRYITFHEQQVFEQKKPKLVDNEKQSPKKIRGVRHNIATFFRSLFQFEKIVKYIALSNNKAIYKQ